MKRLFLTIFAAALAVSGQAFSVDKLRTEYMETPMGIDVRHPRFSWQMQDATRGAAQSAYRIVVNSPDGSAVWDSGKTEGDISLNIVYNGRELEPMTRYSWTVEVWNGKGEKESAASWFETGLMSTSDKDAAWSGAKWIGGGVEDALTFFSQYLPVFRLTATLQLDRKTKSSEAGIIYGANDIRLMDRNKNILGVENAKDASYIKICLNTAPLDRGDSAAVEIYRVGYTLEDSADKPFSTAKLAPGLIGKGNRYGSHNIQIRSMHGTTDIFIDGQQVVSGLNLNPMGRGGDYISFPNVGDVGFYVPEGQKATFIDAGISNFRAPNHTLAIIADNLTLSGKTEIFTPTEHGAPLLRSEFSTEGKGIAKARLYASARGIYEIYINGSRIADDYLNPGLTQYNKTLFYQTYDVTPLLKDGKNGIGAQLSEGWWSGACTYSGENWNFFGDRQSMLAELVINYSDGSVQRVVTDPAAWKYSTDGTVRIGSLFQGEVYDASKEAAFSGWSEAGFDDSGWKPAVEVPLEGVISHEKPSGRMMMWPTPDDYSHFQLISQIGRPVEHYTTLTARTVTEVRPGVFVYDMGQNMAGVPEISFSGLKPGQKVYMRFAEVLYPDMPEYKGNEGMVMMENQRGAMEQDIYIAKGGDETFTPRLTYHGFRYIEITGIPKALPVDKVKGLVLSTVDKFSADYRTDNSLLNRFFENVKWSTLANVFSIPTDCPQRNERMGWSGDLSVFSPAMSYLFDGDQFLSRHLLALRDTQLEDGNFPAIAPIGGGFGGPLWASVGITMPWQSYLQYGDIEALREHYPAMRKFMDLYTTKYIDKENGGFNYTDGIGLGDWLGFEVNKNSNSMLFDCYLVHELDIMTSAAKILGETGDAEKYEAIRKQRTDFINAHYIDPNSGMTVHSGLEKNAAPFGGGEPKPKGVPIDAQTSYALPLVFDIVSPEIRDKFVEKFLNTVSRRSTGDDGVTYPEYSLMTGFIGTAWISLALSDSGHSDYAYRMLENTAFPSWLYPVTQGATTIWERLNSYTDKDGFGGNNSMNSFNHYAFGSVTNWLMQRSLGIARDEDSPAFKHFFLRPEPDFDGGLHHAEGHYDSMYGRIESSWTISEDGTVDYSFTVPANTSATLLLPASSDATITLEGKPVNEVIKTGDGRCQLELTSGQYHFKVNNDI